MAKRLSIYFGILIAAVIIPALSLIIWAYTQINVSKSIITEQDFVAKAEALNAQVTATKLNVKTEDNKYSADEINNLVQKVVQKSLSAKNDSLDLLFIKCINNKVAYNFYLEEYNAKVAKKQQLAEESGNKQMRTSLNGKNFNYSEVYTNYGNYAFIRVENVYLGVVSFDDNVFREAVKTFGFEKPLNFEMGQIIALAITINLFAFFAMIVCFQIPLAYIFKKANIHPAIAFIPFFNRYFLCKMVDHEGWKMIFFYIPIVGVVYYLMISLKLAKAFNKSEIFGIGLFFVPVIFMPIIAFDDSKLEENSKNIYEEILKEYE